MKQCKKNLERLLGAVAAVMLCISSLLQVPVMADELKVYARAALLMDASNGRILYEENGYEKLPMGFHHKDHDLHSGTGIYKRA